MTILFLIFYSILFAFKWRDQSQVVQLIVQGWSLIPWLSLGTAVGIYFLILSVDWIFPYFNFRFFLCFSDKECHCHNILGTVISPLIWHFPVCTQFLTQIFIGEICTDWLVGEPHGWLLAPVHAAPNKGILLTPGAHHRMSITASRNYGYPFTPSLTPLPSPPVGCQCTTRTWNDPLCGVLMHPLGTQHGMLAYNSSSPRFFFLLNFPIVFATTTKFIWAPMHNMRCFPEEVASHCRD